MKYALALSFGLLLAAPAYGAAASAPPPAVAQSVDLTGQWKGEYVGGASDAPVPFDATMASAGAAFVGKVVEPNTFGDQHYRFLLSTLTGSVAADGTVTFVKSYDGSANVGHSVTYVGRLEDGGRRIRGNWSIGNMGGPFEMAR